MVEHAVRTYDTQYVNLIIDGVAVTGFAEGSMLKAERNEDSFNAHVGAQGEVSFSETNNFTGTITFSVTATSPSNEMLRAWAKKKGKNAIFAASIVDANEEGGMLVSSSQSRIQKIPQYEANTEEAVYEWSIYCAYLNFDEN